MKPNKNLAEIVAEWLRDNGYDGLFYDEGCACSVDDLFPCDNANRYCEAGYKEPCDGTCDVGTCDWHITRAKGGSDATD